MVSRRKLSTDGLLDGPVANSKDPDMARFLSLSAPSSPPDVVFKVAAIFIMSIGTGRPVFIKKFLTIHASLYTLLVTNAS